MVKIERFIGFINENRNNKEIILQSKRNRNIIITLDIEGGRITNIDNPNNFRFLYQVGELYNRGVETWAKNNNFLFNGKDLSENDKIMGIRKKDIPQGHPLRQIYKNKF